MLQQFILKMLLIAFPKTRYNFLLYLDFDRYKADIKLGKLSIVTYTRSAGL